MDNYGKIAKMCQHVSTAFSQAIVVFVHAEAPVESSRGSSTIRRRRLVHWDQTAAGTAQFRV